MTTITRDAVLAALSKVQEPELHQDLVSLGMVRDLKIEGQAVSFTVMLTTTRLRRCADASKKKPAKR